MAASYKRVLVQIGSVRFFPVEARYSLTREPAADADGKNPLRVRAFTWMDADDVSRISQDDLIALWKKATAATPDREKVAITFYRDNDARELGSVEFMGWITRFELFNPLPGETYDRERPVTSVVSGFNNVFYLEIAAALDAEDAPKHKLTR